MSKSIKATLVLAALSAMAAAGAQTPVTQGSTAQAAATAPSSTAKAKLSRADRKIVVDMAMANMAEIDAARTAQSKSQNAQVKSFAQQMIDDHTKALDEVKQLAQTRGVNLPTELDRAHKAKAERMAALSGEAFDRAYLAQEGVTSHQQVHEKLAYAQSHAKDPELKALAERTLPVVNAHLSSAEQLNKSTAVGSSHTQGTTETSPDKPKPETKK